jgi:bacillithiol biosynthesis deacetylase BshB1
MKVDILAFGAHPDDIELSCAGTLIHAQQQGLSLGLVDLTQGELGTRGNVELRMIEAANSAKLMNAQFRTNLKFRDGFIENTELYQLEIIKQLRLHTPTFVFCNAPEDRHPDHGKASKLVADACFLSGLAKIEIIYNGVLLPAYRPPHIFFYIQDKYLQPSFVYDVSSTIDLKMACIMAFESQFYNPHSTESTTYISSPYFIEGVKAKMSVYGKMMNVPYAEGFITANPIGINSLLNFKTTI